MIMDFGLGFTLVALDELEVAEVQEGIVLCSRPPVQWLHPLARITTLALESGDLAPIDRNVLDVYRPADVPWRRVLLAHTEDGTPAQVRKAASAAAALLAATKPTAVALAFAQQPDARQLQAALLAVAETTYRFELTKTEPKGRFPQTLHVAVPDPAAVQAAFDAAVATVHGVEFAKDWANRPANHATPRMLARAAASLKCYARITCKVLDAGDAHKLGMGAFLAVAQGSEEPPQFIVLRYNAPARKKKADPTPQHPPIVLVGKGITFDSGGICIKPAADMDEMKFDMSGAASVLGVFRALGELQPDISVVGLIPACENLPSGRAVKPGDVVTSLSGQTIEILNTDAEGRLILCDALAYAQRFAPHAVIDIATLTGACVIALGKVRSGLFASDAALSAALSAAGDAALDPCWPLPLDEEYAEGLKSNFADVANVAGRPAGVITAAKFLQRFAQGYPWAHLDIAGTAWKSGDAKGATGRPVPLLLEYLLATVQAVGE
ncbi:leucyl aminopeptidase [Candidatus Symbiobacter mobilis]|nr:leucyl aminopeptidase [Candidatus Symbiobacter mobilis]